MYLLKRCRLKVLVFRVFLIFSGVIALAGCAQDENKLEVVRLSDGPIIGPELHDSIGLNIQVPSLIRVPEWLPNKLGNYYLYFADHKGSYIRLAYADDLLGPWKIFVPGTLQIEDSYFLVYPPEISDQQVEEMAAQRQSDWTAVSHDWRTELTSPHIASPDVHVDDENKQIIMYYHGLDGPGRQLTRVATSNNGVDFTAQPQNLGRTYMRTFKFGGFVYSMAMPGQFYRSRDGFTNFEEGPKLFNANMRHAGLLVKESMLYVFWTQVGDAPENIKLSMIDLTKDWMSWSETEAIEILRPEKSWEGASATIEPSVRSTAYGVVNQLRDPAIFSEGHQTYLLYTVGGEAGIAIAELKF